MEESPYLTRTGWNGLCPLDESGWTIRPSMAAHMTILRAIPGIMRGVVQKSSPNTKESEEPKCQNTLLQGNRE